MRSCETVAKIELCSKSLARHLAPHLLQMFSLCAIYVYVYLYCGTTAVSARNEGEKRFFDKGSLGPGAFVGDHLYLFSFFFVVQHQGHTTTAAIFLNPFWTSSNSVLAFFNVIITQQEKFLTL